MAKSQYDSASEQLALVQAGPRRERIEGQRAQVAQAEAAVRQIEATIANMTIRSTFDGVVTVRHREPGEIVPAGAAVLTVMNPADRWVRIYVPETRIGRMRLGLPAELTCDTFKGKQYERGDRLHREPGGVHAEDGADRRGACEARLCGQGADHRGSRARPEARDARGRDDRPASSMTDADPKIGARPSGVAPAPTGAPPAIVAQGLTRRFRDLVAVDAIDLSVAPGELFGLVGPDGAGKTTTLRMLAGVMRPSAGDARVGGISVVRDPEAVKHRIAYMPQRFGLYADLTVMENILFFADLYRVPRADRPARIERLFRFSNLGPFADRLAGRLSGGMKQKLALSCALIHQPEILLLDEPTFGVDPISRRDLWLIVHEMVHAGRRYS